MLLANLSRILNGTASPKEAHTILQHVSATLRHTAIIKAAAQNNIPVPANTGTTPKEPEKTYAIDDALFEAIIEAMPKGTKIQPPTTPHSGQH